MDIITILRVIAILSMIGGVSFLIFRIWGLYWYRCTAEGQYAQTTDAANNIRRQYPIIVPLILMGIGYLGMQYI